MSHFILKHLTNLFVKEVTMSKKRILSLLTALVLALALLPATALAQDTVTLPEGVDTDSFGTNTVYYDGNYYATLV